MPEACIADLGRTSMSIMPENIRIVNMNPDLGRIEEEDCGQGNS